LSCFCLFIVGVLHSKLIKAEVWDIVWNGYDTIFTFLNVIFIYILCLNYKKDYSFIRAISTNTLGIYFIHGLLLRLLNGIFTFDILRNLPFNLVYSFAIVCICLLISVLIKKIPIIRKLV
jgi:surface polysaccharide O-acyltransferase-like enzyme